MVLDPAYVEDAWPDGMPMGECHLVCLTQSPHGALWTRWSLASAKRRGWVVVAELRGWTLLHRAQNASVLAIHHDGTCCDGSLWKPLRTFESCVAFESSGLHFFALPDRPDVIADLQAHLREGKTPSLLRIVEAAGHTDKMRWPAAIAASTLHLDEEGTLGWSATAVGAVVTAMSAFPLALGPALARLQAEAPPPPWSDAED